MEKYIKQDKPFVVPTTDGKLIEEHFGNGTVKSPISIARMVAPPQWEEPYQTPEFDEYTLIFRGKKQVIIDGKKIILQAGESLLVKAGTRVKYANPFDEEVEYVAICNPAFDFNKVNREE